MRGITTLPSTAIAEVIQWLPVVDIVRLSSTCRALIASVGNVSVRIAALPKPKPIIVNDDCVRNMMRCTECLQVGDEESIRAKLIEEGKSVMEMRLSRLTLAVFRKVMSDKWITVRHMLAMISGAFTSRRENLRAIMATHSLHARLGKSHLINEMGLLSLLSLAFRPISYYNRGYRGRLHDDNYQNWIDDIDYENDTDADQWYWGPILDESLSHEEGIGYNCHTEQCDCTLSTKGSYLGPPQKKSVLDNEKISSVFNEFIPTYYSHISTVLSTTGFPGRNSAITGFFNDPDVSWWEVATRLPRSFLERIGGSTKTKSMYYRHDDYDYCDYENGSDNGPSNENNDDHRDDGYIDQNTLPSKKQKNHASTEIQPVLCRCNNESNLLLKISHDSRIQIPSRYGVLDPIQTGFKKYLGLPDNNPFLLKVWVEGNDHADPPDSDTYFAYVAPVPSSIDDMCRVLLRDEPEIMGSLFEFS